MNHLKGPVFRSRVRVISVLTLLIGVGGGLVAAQEAEPVGMVISATALSPGVTCEVDAEHQCAFVSSEVQRCSMPIESGCQLFSGDRLMLSGVRIEYRLCDGPVRRLNVTNGLVQYELAGACPDDVEETLSVLYDLELESVQDE